MEAFPGAGDPLLGAERALEELEAWCGRGTDLWGRDLCGPMMLVEPESRWAVANAPPPDTAFRRPAPGHPRWAGTLPDSIPLANTAFEWGERRWSMVLLPLPTDPYDRTALLAHEAFHRVQPALGLEAPTPVPPHLQERTGRLWLRLEIRALAEALRTGGDQARRAARDALLFRRARHAVHPGADTLEAGLEIHEGLAAWTGSRVARDALGLDDARVAEEVLDHEDRESYGRSFPYATGPALGMLLDRWAPVWREEVGRNAPPGVLLERALSPVAGDPVERAAGYGWSEVAAEEEARERSARARLDTLRRRFTEPPLLRVESSETRGSFDPRNTVSLGENGTIYFGASFRGEWGVLTADEGVLVSPDWTVLSVPGPVQGSGGTWSGPGWTLETAEGWTVERVGEGRWRLERPLTPWPPTPRPRSVRRWAAAARPGAGGRPSAARGGG